MGLAGQRKRTKISNDPNNTQWTRSETSFGKKILQSQGWTPGALLGAENAPHAHLHSAASASHVRVTLKDDNLGLGAKRGSGVADGECVGLDAFQGLLGRLNGKSDDVLQKEQDSRNDLRREMFVEKRWGQMRFVKAGLLVGDKVYGLEDPNLERVKEEEKARGEKTESGDEISTERDEKRSKKEKRSAKKSKVELDGDSQIKSSTTTSSVDGDGGRSKERRKESKKRKHKHSDDLPETIAAPAQNTLETKESAESLTDPKEARRRRKLERRETREARRLRKEQKRNKSSASKDAVDEDPQIGVSKDVSSTTSDADTTQPTTPQAAASANSFSGGRHAVRQRYIMQKKMAVADSRAMNEIFMIKA
ncbi:MAG: inositol polyphosphate 5-phosphatase [Chaenotheca gracillima]|nr:MAG: inositol polyphosphate 5-phosphatase [Chaenotheca gracillima]